MSTSTTTPVVKEANKHLSEYDYDVPSSRNTFVLEVEENFFKKIRKAAGSFPSLYFSVDLMALFFEYCNARKKEEEEQEDADGILAKLTKKTKSEEGLALVAVTRRYVGNDNWAPSTTEEPFIDQYLLPLVQVIFMNDCTYVHSKKNSFEQTALFQPAKKKDTCLMLKPDFCVMYEFQGNNVGLLAIEAKSPDACSSQALSDRSKLALELKRMVDQQIILGSRDPKLKRLSLLKSDDDLMLIPDLVLMFMGRAINDSIARFTKKQKTEQPTALVSMIKQTVGLPTKGSLSCT
ncbi:hypothetical protein BD560DRAFT_448361 [Blakeslea trispora]|nr:hypothetical protein BD560DRAFT_448361 [Blakeslea trispora]